MKSVKQEDLMGCSVACVAFILNISYQESLILFKDEVKDGKEKVKKKGFTCKEIVTVLASMGLKYEYRYIKNRIYKNIKSNTIFFLKRSKRYPIGHYLCRDVDKWMDSWINFPEKNIKARFRYKLPGKPIYAIFPKKIS